MSDSKKEEKKDAHGGGEAAAAPAKPGGMKGGMGAIIAGVILLAVGAGLGMSVAKLVAKLSAGDPTEAAAEGHGTAATKKEEHATNGESHGGMHDLKEVTLPELMSNIKNQQGRRYVKVACSLWITNADALTLGFAGGGGHGGGGEAGGNIKRLIQQALEEHLKNYDMEELTGPHIYQQLKKGFRDAVERTLHEVFPETADDHKFVERIVLTGLIVQ
jgi:flagellar basal body-associated protein FliL